MKEQEIHTFISTPTSYTELPQPPPAELNSVCFLAVRNAVFSCYWVETCLHSHQPYSFYSLFSSSEYYCFHKTIIITNYQLIINHYFTKIIFICERSVWEGFKTKRSPPSAAPASQRAGLALTDPASKSASFDLTKSI